jgi:hypothetical protein
MSPDYLPPGPETWFGAIAIGDSRTIEFKIASPSQHKITAVSILGANASDFRLDPGNCRKGTEIAQAGKGCTLRVTFTPTAEGERTARLLIEHDPGQSTEERLRGAKVPHPVAAALGADDLGELDTPDGSKRIALAPPG